MRRTGPGNACRTTRLRSGRRTGAPGVTESTARQGSATLIGEAARSCKTSVRAMARRRDPRQRAAPALHDLPYVPAASAPTPG